MNRLNSALRVNLFVLIASLLTISGSIAPSFRCSPVGQGFGHDFAGTSSQKSQDNIHLSQTGVPSSSNPPVPPPISGSVKILVIPVQFPDFHNVTSIGSMFTLRLAPLISYYNEVSYGLLSLEIYNFTSWFTLPNSRAYYGVDSDTVIDVNSWSFAADSLNAADTFVNYHDYDCVMFVHAGNDQASSGNPFDLWSQASLGKEHFANDGGVDVCFMILAETDPFGVFAHEFGHNIELPDLYDYGYKADFAGSWSLMSNGSWLVPPASLMAPEKVWLGWIPSSNVTVVDTGQILNVSISRLETSSQTLAVKIPLAQTYYVIEYRRKVLTDSALPREGVIISYVNTSVESGYGVIKVKDAKPNTKTLDDGAFTPGMRFVDAASEVAVKIWSLGSDVANVMVQKGFADLLPDSIQFIGEPLENESTYFDVPVKNSGVTASNSAWVSLSINGTEFQRTSLASVDPNSTTVLHFGPWQAKSGLNQIRVSVDVNDDVAEKNETNNVMSVSLDVSPRDVVIDKALVSRQRTDVNTSQQVLFHAKWSENNSDVVDGTIYVNGSAYVTNSTGWITITVISPTVVKMSWLVTGVDVDGFMLYRQQVPDPYVIWDVLEVYDSGVSKGRCDVGSDQTIWARLRYAFDGRAFDNTTGALWIGGKIAIWNGGNVYWCINDSRNEVSQSNYTIPTDFEDNLYGLTAVSGQAETSIIWDVVAVTLAAKSQRVNVGSTANMEVNGTYEYDSTPWEGTVTFNDTLVKSEVGRFSYVLTSIIDSKYGLSTFRSNIASVIFDRVLLDLSFPDDRINVGAIADVAISGVYEHDHSTWEGVFILNDTLAKNEVGNFSFVVVSISDSVYNLTVFESNSASEVWDRVNIVSFTLQERISVGAVAPINWTAIYEYDTAAFTGSIALDHDIISGSVGLVAYGVKSISDPLYGLTTFTNNTVNVIFDEIICQTKMDTLMPGRVRLQFSLAYRFDGSPVTDANVTIGHTQALDMGHGEYEIELSEWKPYASYDVRIEREASTKNVPVSFIVIGNLAIVATVPIVIAVSVLLLKRRKS